MDSCADYCGQRVVLSGHWEGGFFALVPVGAQNVGSISIATEKDFRSNLKEHNWAVSKPHVFVREYNKPLRMAQRR